MTDDYVTVVGLDRTIARLDPKRWDAAARTGLLRAGQVAIEARARTNIKPHTYTGNLAHNLHTDVRGSGLNLEAHIGISNSVAPEGTALEFGRRAGGKQPPIDAIARWLTSKPELLADIAGSSGKALVGRNGAGHIVRRGTISSISADARVRSRAFLIARAIGRRGFSFGKLEWLKNAGRDGRVQARQIIRDALATVR